MSGQSWQSKIPLRTRIRVGLRDAYVRSLYNPWQVFRRRHGLADRDVFGQIKIQTNSTCTRRCSFCHYGQAEPPRPQAMDEGLFSLVIESLARIGYAGSVGLFEINEPLTDKRIVAFHALTRRRLPKAWLYLASNGDLLREGVLRELFAAGLNILYLNSYDEPALARNLAFLDGLEPALRRRVHHLNRTYQEDWESRGGNIARFHKGAVAAPCDLVYNLCYVKPGGTVHPCINDFYDKAVMGDVHDADLLDIWFGANMKALRAELNRGNRACNALCAQCDYPGFRSLPRVPLEWRLARLLPGRPDHHEPLTRTQE